ncbi:MAG: hypothetical protein IJG87_00825 [Ruminococcus sp.]|nr:hypothetical protein [Ruminococcus sp.]
MPNYNDSHRPNAIERDRMERRRQLKRKSMITNILVIAVVAAVVIGIIIAIVALTGKNKKDDQNTEPTAVTATIASETQKPKATAAQQPTLARADGQNDAVTSQDDDVYGAAENSDDNSSSSSQTVSSSSASSDASSGAAMSTGNSIHYTASGSTSYGYDWTYSGGGGIVDVSCNYDFDTHQYDFVITGLSEGTTNLTLYYNTADGVQQPVNMTVSVDSNLNVSQN